MDKIALVPIRRSRRRLCIAILAAPLVLVSACATADGQVKGDQASARAVVDDLLQTLSRALRDGGSDSEDLFSRSFETGYEGLRDRIVDSRRGERITDLQFIVNRVLENDRKLNVQVRWNKAFIDRQGKPGRRSGTAEMVFEPAGSDYRILSIRGDQFL